ncbi:MAG: hypothetical protein JJT90_00245 [Ectothiorhodospiraceae bacterium]|nr:hypothetical protein [Ectothiorhodospiraceae bacterium]
MTRLISSRALPGGFRLLQVGDTDAAAEARPGHWFTLSVQDVRLRLPALDASPREGWIAFQAPPAEAESLPPLPYGTHCTLDGPHGDALRSAPEGRRLILIADESGVSAALFCAACRKPSPALVLVELHAPVPPIRHCPSRFLEPYAPPGAIAGLKPLEEAGIPSRICHPMMLPGCAEGRMETLLQAWLTAHSAEQRWRTAMAAIGLPDFIQRLAPVLRGQLGAYTLHTLPPTRG